MPGWDPRIERLRERLSRRTPRPGPRLPLPGGRAPAPASVLITILAPGWLVYTQRSTTLSQHAGQVSFPGGKPEPGDADAFATAVRETEEEIGVPRTGLSPLGQLDGVPTPSGFVVTPFVALWTEAEPPELRPLTAEVEAVHVAPLDVLADPAIHSQRERPWRGMKLESHEFHVPALSLPDGSEQAAIHVWGATGRMTRQLLDLSR